MVPIEHTPVPVHVPESRQRPPSQTCICMPHIAHGIMRGGSPGVQLHVVGAVHAAHTPSVQRSTPVPQLELHVRSAMRPTVALMSSQSTLASTPSWSRSVPDGTQTPPEHTSFARHAGVHAPPSLPPPSLRAPSVPPPSVPRLFTPVPLAHPSASPPRRSDPTTTPRRSMRTLIETREGGRAKKRGGFPAEAPDQWWNSDRCVMNHSSAHVIIVRTSIERRSLPTL